MRVRVGRERSLVSGILSLLVMVVGLVILSSANPAASALGWFRGAWVLVCLAGAALSFYNAFSRRGVSLYEIETGEGEGRFCPKCGKPVGEDHSFCRYCGSVLR